MTNLPLRTLSSEEREWLSSVQVKELYYWQGFKFQEWISEFGPVQFRVLRKLHSGEDCVADPGVQCVKTTTFLQFTNGITRRREHRWTFKTDCRTSVEFTYEDDVCAAFCIATSKNWEDVHARFAFFSPLRVSLRRNLKSSGESKGLDGTVKDRYDKHMERYNPCADVCKLTLSNINEFGFVPDISAPMVESVNSGGLDNISNSLPQTSLQNFVVPPPIPEIEPVGESSLRPQNKLSADEIQRLGL